MSQPLIIIGAGGHSKVLINALILQKATIKGIVDTDKKTHGSEVLGIPVLGDESVLEKFPKTEVNLVNGVGSTDSMDRRTEVFNKFKQMGYKFETVVHPSAVVAPSVKLREGCQVMAGAVIQPDCNIGRNTIINTSASIDHDCKIGDHVHIAPGAILSGSVSVGSSSHIGTGAVIIQNIEIGEKSTIGAGSTVIKTVATNVKAVGTPAKALS